MSRRELAQLLTENTSPPGNTNRINYDKFCVIGALVSPRAQRFFEAENFLKFRRDKYVCFSLLWED